MVQSIAFYSLKQCFLSFRDVLFRVGKRVLRVMKKAFVHHVCETN